MEWKNTKSQSCSIKLHKKGGSAHASSSVQAVLHPDVDEEVDHLL